MGKKDVATRRSSGSQEVIVPGASQLTFTTSSLPLIVASAGPAAGFAWEEFFLGNLRNAHTRTAYRRAVQQFLDWLAPQHVDLAQITPGMVGTYLDQHPGSPPSKKQHLAAIRGLFDMLVLRHVMVLNPANSVRGQRYECLEGKTPEITIDQARTLIASINVSTPVGLRDRAVIAVLIYTAARAGAVAKLRLKHFTNDGTQWSLRFDEKGGKARDIPVRHNLQIFLLEYLKATDLAAASRDTPLFRSTVRRTGRLTANPITGVDICRMMKRRLKDAGLPGRLSPHSFRSCTATDLLLQNVPLEDVQFLLGHRDPRTTRLYDRRQKTVTRNTVERISI